MASVVAGLLLKEEESDWLRSSTTNHEPVINTEARFLGTPVMNCDSSNFESQRFVILQLIRRLRDVKNTLLLALERNAGNGCKSSTAEMSKLNAQ